jgi:hypothetical protein
MRSTAADFNRETADFCVNMPRTADMKFVGEKTAMQNRGLAQLWKQFSWLVQLTLLSIALRAQTPPTTTVSDTVYRADGSPAAGTLLISWPAFTTSGGTAIAGGTKSVTLGAGGALSVALVPNAGATPATTVYTVVYQLTATIEAIENWKKQVGLSS